MPRDDRPRPVPWVTHALAAVVVPVWMLQGPLREHGLTEGVQDHGPPLVGPALFLLGAALAVVLAMLEVWTLRLLRSRWAARAGAMVATSAVAWVGSLPVTFQLADSSPVDRGELHAALTSIAVLLAGHLLAVLLVDRFVAREHAGVRG